jgi:excisionase family DNA binding protein
MQMLDADELAEKLKVSRRQIQLLAERREIPFYRVGPRALRFDEVEVMKAISMKPYQPKTPPEAA